MNAKVMKLLRACRKQAGYGKGYRWEVQMDYAPENHSNHPFKRSDDHWSGESIGWCSAIVYARVGSILNCPIYSTGPDGELKTNIWIEILSETTATYEDCGEGKHIVTL